jgi:hypothetical protein
MRVGSPSPGLVPVHIGQPEPGSEQDQMVRLRAECVNATYERQQLPRVPDGLDWHKHGMQPRWLGMETSDCAVALEPSIFHGHGADELDRFLHGARSRSELALVVAVIGDADDDRARSPLTRFDSSVRMNKTLTSIYGRRLPAGTRPVIVPELSSADRDLAMRLLSRPADAPWWSLHLSGSQVERRVGSGPETYEPEGRLQPILVDGLGDPLVAAWTSPSGDQRWYIIPDATGWASVLGWLVQQALPEYVPGALRRARSPLFTDPDLQTTAELDAWRALGDLEARYAAEKLYLEEALREAQARAEDVRYGLLYGTGTELVRAVAAVLAAAGLSTVDLDEALGATSSADLLVSGGGQARLVEVKAASGAAPELMVSHLQRHLDTWPQLRPDEPVAGGVLVVNDQHRLHPSERTTQVYSRPEFVASLHVTVVSTLELFRWWRTEDWVAIRAAVIGGDADPSAPAAGAAPREAGPATPMSARRSRWRQRPGHT